jgi:hypothetical protein
MGSVLQWHLLVGQHNLGFRQECQAMVPGIEVKGVDDDEVQVQLERTFPA